MPISGSCFARVNCLGSRLFMPHQVFVCPNFFIYPVPITLFVLLTHPSRDLLMSQLLGFSMENYYGPLTIFISSPCRDIPARLFSVVSLASLPHFAATSFLIRVEGDACQDKTVPGASSRPKFSPHLISVSMRNKSLRSRQSSHRPSGTTRRASKQGKWRHHIFSTALFPPNPNFAHHGPTRSLSCPHAKPCHLGAQLHDSRSLE